MKVEEKIKASRDRQLVTLRGKAKICPKIRKAFLKDDLSYELIKVKYCYKCPFSPTKKRNIKRELIDEILSEKVISTPILEDYYNRGICPAEVIQIASKEFNTIFMTYAWLDFVRDIGKGVLADIFEDAVIIFDEARHLENFGVSTKCIGQRSPNKGLTLHEGDRIVEILQRTKRLMNTYRSKGRGERSNVTAFREVLKTYRNFMHSGSYGLGGGLPFKKKKLWKTIFFLQNILLKGAGGMDSVRHEIEDAMILLLWLHKNHDAEFFFDYNKVMNVDETSNLFITARTPKLQLVTIFDDARQVFLVDSTPPPLRWSKLWLGKEYDIDVVEINPETMPDINIWVDGVDRRWSKMYFHKDIFASFMTLLKGIVRKSGLRDWTISVRSKSEKNIIKQEWSDAPTIIYQGGVESEGIQLSGDHILTGVQYQHQDAFISQKDYVSEVLGVRSDEGKNRLWEKYINEKSYQSLVQQMFRTYYYGRSTNVILLGISEKTIEKVKSRFPYLRLAHWQISQMRRFDGKMKEILYLIKHGVFGSKGDVIRDEILDTCQGLSVKDTYHEMRKVDTSITLGLVKNIMKNKEGE